MFARLVFRSALVFGVLSVVVVLVVVEFVDFVVVVIVFAVVVVVVVVVFLTVTILFFSTCTYRNEVNGIVSKGETARNRSSNKSIRLERNQLSNEVMHNLTTVSREVPRMKPKNAPKIVMILNCFTFSVV